MRILVIVTASWLLLAALMATPIGGGAGLILTLIYVMATAVWGDGPVHAAVVVILGASGMAAVLGAASGVRAWSASRREAAFLRWTLGLSASAPALLILISLCAAERLVD